MADNILLLGGAGYIGSHAAKQLHKHGFVPVTFDNLSRGHKQAVQWGPLVEDSIGNGEALAQCLREYRPIAAMHFAAFAYIEESVRDPGLYYRNNFVATQVLLDCLVAAKVKTLVFSSSCATFGIPEHLPISETTPQNPINPYGRTKVMAEAMLNDYDAAYGLKSVCLRYFNAAGADPEGHIGEDHFPEPHLIPLLFDVVLGRREQAFIHGDDYPTPDGTCIRDFIHVSDIAEAHVLALRHLLAGGESQRYNLGNGKGYSVREVIASVERVTGHRLPVTVGPRRPGDPPELIATSAKISRELGWRIRYGELDEIVATAWRWHQKKTIQAP